MKPLRIAQRNTEKRPDPGAFFCSFTPRVEGGHE